MSETTNFIDPSLLASVDNLELRARVTVEGFLNGLHRSPQRGFSVEFTDYRHYNQGDDTRHIDWKLYGRSNKLYIKQFEDETNSRCMILLDTSASMGYCSGDASQGAMSKLDYGRTLAAAMAYFVMRQRDAVGLVTFADQIQELIPAYYRKTHLLHILRTLVHTDAAQSTNIAKPLQTIAGSLRSRSFVMLISDMLEGEVESIKLLQQLRAMGHEVILFHVMDNAELNFTFDNAAEFIDMETSQRIKATPGAIRDGYLDAVNEFITYCKKQCQTHGVDYCLLNTQEPLDKALAAYLKARGGGF